MASRTASLARRCTAGAPATAFPRAFRFAKPSGSPREIRFTSSNGSPLEPSAKRGLLRALALTSGALGLGYAIALAFPPEIIRVIRPPVAPVSPLVDSPEGIAATQKVEAELQTLEVVRKLRGERNEDGTPRWEETRPYARADESRRRHSLTAGSLRGPGKLAVPPLCFARDNDRDNYLIVHLGRSLCGHDGIIHGGLLATILDESLARPAILSLPSTVGVTATLDITYKAPTMADQFVVVHTQCTKVDGRKAYTEGSISTLDGKLLVEATALFVEPRMASMLDASGIKKVLGKEG